MLFFLKNYKLINTNKQKTNRELQIFYVNINPF